MSGLPREEYMRNFRDAEQELRAKGYTNIVNPINVWACRWPWLYRIIGYRLTLWYDLRLLKKCDAIYLLKGWEYSFGAFQEWAEAWLYNLEIYKQEETNL